MNPRDYQLDFAPYRLTGTVYGTLLNDKTALAALGASVNDAPYKGAPQAPVLYLKPVNTFQVSGAQIPTSADVSEWEIGGTLALVIGRTACRVAVDAADQYIAGYVVVADLSVPHTTFYRPSIRFKARDGSLVVGSTVVPRASIPDPQALTMRVRLDGEVSQEATFNQMNRSAAQLLADVSDFMTLAPGDILMLGVPHGAPRARSGQRVTVEIEGVGSVDMSFLEKA